MKKTAHTPAVKALAAALYAFLADFSDYDGPTHSGARAALRGAGFEIAGPQGEAAYPAPLMTRAEFAELLAARVSGLGTDEDMEGGDTVAALSTVYEELRSEAGDSEAEDRELLSTNDGFSDMVVREAEAMILHAPLDDLVIFAYGSWAAAARGREGGQWREGGGRRARHAVRGATTPPARCRCRCGGRCHGRRLVAQSAGREGFEHLPRIIFRLWPSVARLSVRREKGSGVLDWIGTGALILRTCADATRARPRSWSRGGLPPPDFLRLIKYLAKQSH